MPERHPWLATIGTTGALIGTLAGVGPEQHLHNRRDDAAAQRGQPEQIGTQSQQEERDGWTIVQTARAGEDAASHDGRTELDVVLDAMLVTERVPAGVPFELRTGHVDDPRVLEIMREIDETLGGRIEWPNVYVTNGLPSELVGKYQTWTQNDGRTTWPEERAAGADHLDDRLGIKLDRELVEQELATGEVTEVSVRQLLVHELQHAVSFDNERSLLNAAERSRSPYEEPDNPTSEGRAEMAMLLAAEMEQRRAAGGPRLNELTVEDRREVVREVLTQYITPYEHPVSRQADDRLLAALRAEHYIHDEENLIWREVSDERTDAYLTGTERYETPHNAFIPTAMDGRERYDELFTPLDELAERWSEERADGRRQATARTRDNRGDGRTVEVSIGTHAYEPAEAPAPAAGTSRREAPREREHGDRGVDGNAR